MPTETKKCLIINFTELPPDMRDEIRDWVGFHNDCLLELCTELSMDDFRQGMASIENYMNDQADSNEKYNEYNPSGTLEGFLEPYGLKFSAWVIEQNFDLTDVDQILINISW